MYNYNYGNNEEVVVISQPENLSTPDIVKKVGFVHRVYDGQLSQNSDMDWFCDLKIGRHIFTWVSLSCIYPTKKLCFKSETDNKGDTDNKSDKSKYPTYHEMLDYLCRELGVPGSPDFNGAVQWVKQDLEKLQAIEVIVARRNK